MKPITDFYAGGYTRCKKCDRVAAKKYEVESPVKFRLTAARKRLKYAYGLEWEDYLKLCEEQSNVCKLCGKDNKGWQLAVDHCHKTGKVRGLLCNQCNRALGMLKDDPELLRKAADYIDNSIDKTGAYTH